MNNDRMELLFNNEIITVSITCIFQFLKGAANDCSTCASGSTGTSCEPDLVNCEGLPWYRDDLCGDQDYVAAGNDGCSKCDFIRSICATSCNWCTT